MGDATGPDYGPPTAALARFATAGLRWADLPERVRREARRTLLNVLACALGGQRDAALRHLSAVLLPMAGPPAATAVGHACRVDAATAAFLNAAAANVQDFDDQHLPTIMHPGPPIAAAALAAAERRGADGASLLAAIALGVEVGCRVGHAVHPGHYARGFHITATCGVFGAAAAVSGLLGLDARRAGWAFGHAAAAASGLVESLGAMSKSVGVGGAARSGLAAALFAQAGLEGPALPLEGRFGFLNVMAEAPDARRITAGLGSDWEMLRNGIKAYPVGVVLHPVVDACLELRARPGFAAEALEGLELHGHALLRLRADRPAVTTGREAVVSAQHVAAAALLLGEVGPAQLTDQCVADPALAALRPRVRVLVDNAVPVEAVRLVARFADGRGAEEVTVAHGRGLPGRPLTDAELEAKVRLLAAWGAPWCDASRLIGLAWDAERLPDLSPLLAAVRPPQD